MTGVETLVAARYHASPAVPAGQTWADRFPAGSEACRQGMDLHLGGGWTL